MSDRKSWKLTLYRLWWAEGYMWVDAFGLGVFMVVLGMGLSALLITVAIWRGPPPENELSTVDGIVETAKRDANEVDVRIVGRAGSYSYSDEETAVDAIAPLITPGTGIEFSVSQRDLTTSTDGTRVWAISVARGAVQRTFGQISTAWYERERNSLMSSLPIILLVTALAAVPFFVTAFFERRWQLERQLPK